MRFDALDLRKELKDTLAALTYEDLTPIQEQVIPALLQQQDIIVRSHTGSGKTLSYALPLLQRLTFDTKQVQGLVLVPTRELAQQVKTVLDEVGLYLGTRHLLLVGKQSFRHQREDLKQRTAVVIATPGRLLQHLQEETISLTRLRFLILDEADEMFRLGFLETLQKIFAFLPPNRQTACFSATYPPAVQAFLNEWLPDARRIQEDVETTLPKGLQQVFYAVSEPQKTEALLQLLRQYDLRRVILFVNTIEQANALYAALRKQELLCTLLHGELTQEERFAHLQQFHDGAMRLLIASNVAARGLDIPDVSLIVNYDFPLQLEAYIHRVGRSARMEAEGTAVSFLTPADQARVKAWPSFSGTLAPFQPKLLYSLDTLRAPLPPETKRSDALRQETKRLCIFAGKNRKLRPGDLVGAICSIPSLRAQDIGVIQIQERQSYVEILHGKGDLVLEALQERTIKNRRFRVEEARSK